jgi:hypothetical protein
MLIEGAIVGFLIEMFANVAYFDPKYVCIDIAFNFVEAVVAMASYSYRWL